MFPDTDFMCFLNVETSLYMDENVETSLFLSVISPGRKCGNIHLFCIIRWFPALKKSILEIQVTRTPLRGVSGYLFFQY